MCIYIKQFRAPKNTANNITILLHVILMDWKLLVAAFYRKTIIQLSKSKKTQVASFENRLNKENLPIRNKIKIMELLK